MRTKRMKALGLLMFLLVLGWTLPATAQEYDSPDEAARALHAAVKAEGNEGLLKLFGEDTRPLLEESDEAGLREGRRLLNLLFEERWSLAPTEEGGRILRLGLEGWPFPVPLVASGSKWRFDTDAGLEEIANRRIGGNELIAIETLKRVVDAEEDYRLRDTNDDRVREYTSRFVSSPGSRDGLYWEAEGEAFSPLQEALKESWKYAEGRESGAPWFGYRFRFLMAQGAKAPGGAFDYLINGRQVAGFALVAYPVQYGKSGVMTFLVNQNGVIYQADLGEETVNQAENMERFDLGDLWVVVEED